MIFFQFFCNFQNMVIFRTSLERVGESLRSTESFVFKIFRFFPDHLKSLMHG